MLNMANSNEIEVSAKTTMLSIPCHDGRIHMQILPAVTNATRYGLGGIRVQQSSILTKCFNQLWAAALNDRARGITHFCMLHSDIVPETEFWLDKMHEIMAENKADVLSVVSPMKNHEGLTSTGGAVNTIDGDPGGIRRLTLKELEKMPDTFTGNNIRVNTGLILVDIRKPWVENIEFQFDDYVRRTDLGFVAFNTPEDWKFSADALNCGASVFATRAIKLTHWGSQGFPNYGAWGELEFDKYNGKAEL